MNIKIMGNFKTGTSSLQNILLNAIKGKYILLNCRHVSEFDKADILIVPIRRHYEIFISGFFQDITKKEYKYCYNIDKNIILNEDIDKLVNFFLKFEWNNEKHLNFNYLIEFINKTVELNDINLVNKEYLVKECKYKKNDKTLKIIFIKYTSLKKERVKEIFDDLLGIDIKFKKKLYHSNNGEKKWYSAKYMEFKKEIEKHPEFIKKYEYLDKNLF